MQSLWSIRHPDIFFVSLPYTTLVLWWLMARGPSAEWFGIFDIIERWIVPWKNYRCVFDVFLIRGVFKREILPSQTRWVMNWKTCMVPNKFINLTITCDCINSTIVSQPVLWRRHFSKHWIVLYFKKYSTVIIIVMWDLASTIDFNNIYKNGIY